MEMKIPLSGEDLIRKRHPELDGFREFLTMESLYDYLVEELKSGELLHLWRVLGCSTLPLNIQEVEVVRIKDPGTHRATTELELIIPEFHRGSFKHPLVFCLYHLFGDVGSGIFTTKEKAEAFLKAAKEAFASDAGWQKYHQDEASDLDLF